MLLEFRTKRNINGHCKYIGIDTNAEVYSITPSKWISIDIPELTAAGYKEILRKVQVYEYKQVDYIY